MRLKPGILLSSLLGGLVLSACGGGSGISTPGVEGATLFSAVSGPVPATATSYPFGAADRTLVPEDLKANGYVEEEFIVSGKANVYDWPAPGPAVVRTADVPYTTRVLIRRPADGKKFSGNVVVELLNASNLFDLNIAWGLSGKHFVDKGDAWVGITSKPVTAASLKKFDPNVMRRCRGPILFRSRTRAIAPTPPSVPSFRATAHARRKMAWSGIFIAK